MKTIVLLAAVLAIAGYTQAAKVQLGAAANGDKSITYTIGTSKITVSTNVTAKLTSLVSTLYGLVVSAISAGANGVKIPITLNTDGSLTIGSGVDAIDFPASFVDELRNVLVFVYKTISTLTQWQRIAGLY